MSKDRNARRKAASFQLEAAPCAHPSPKGAQSAASWRPHRRAFMGGLCAVTMVMLSGPRAGRAGANDAVTQPLPAAPEGLTLRATPGLARLRPGAGPKTGLLTFNGASPGPLLRAKQGDAIAFTLRNELEEPVSLHFAGAGAPNALDGVAGLTGPAVEPGSGRRIAFVAPAAGLFWYRPMIIGQVSRQTGRGLYGALIVDEAAPPQVAMDLLLILDDWLLDDSGQIEADAATVEARSGAGRLGGWLTVNSAAPPGSVTVRPGARLRLRLVNAANARAFPLEFRGLSPQVLAMDGRPCEPFRPAGDQLVMAPGSRVDLVAEAPAATGDKGVLLATLGDGFALLNVRAEGEPMAPPPLAQLPPAPDLPQAIRLQDALRPTLSLDRAGVAADPGRVWTINGKSWPDATAEPLFRVKSGAPVVLQLDNRTSLAQPLHIHGHHVRRLHDLDDGWAPYWLDVVTAPPGRISRFAFAAGAPGKWLVSSSVAERLDGGMAAWFEVMA